MPSYLTKEHDYNIDHFPPTCPRCGKHIAALQEGKATDVTNHIVECLFRCPSCRRYFFGSYDYYGMSQGKLRFTLPASHQPRVFPNISKISSSFQRLFNQSANAESAGLEEIAGTGYRKALEFLIKDYAIACQPEQAETVRKSFLANVIKDFIQDGKLKRVATLTVWIGNDEGHYERRWADKDLTDLKALLEVTIAFVDEQIQLELYSRSMEPNYSPQLRLDGDS